MVKFRIVAAERQLKTVLSLGRAVAGAGVAADLRDRRHHVADEADGVLLLLAGHLYREPARLAKHAEFEGARAVGFGTDQAARRNGDQVRRRLELRQASQIDPFARLKHAGEKHLAIIERVFEFDSL